MADIKVQRGRGHLDGLSGGGAGDIFKDVTIDAVDVTKAFVRVTSTTGQMQLGPPNTADTEVRYFSAQVSLKNSTTVELRHFTNQWWDKWVEFEVWNTSARPVVPTSSWSLVITTRR